MDSNTTAQARPRAARSLILLLATVTLLCRCNALDTGVRAPSQPAGGPGGSDYTHASVTAEHLGEGRDAYWLFYPDEPAAGVAPFVVFLHGWTAQQPDVYSAWIEHIVRKGHIVVYPRYQDCVLNTPAEMRAAASTAIADAWTRTTSQGRVDPQQAGVVWIGHSLGSGLTAILAPQSAELGLPPAAALLLVEPGGRGMDPDEVGLLPTATRVLIVVGEDDLIAGTRTADALTAHLSYLPAENLETVTVRSDRRATPPLLANHFAPLAFSEDVVESIGRGEPAGLRERLQRDRQAQYRPDALDYYAYWKLTDGLLDWAYRGENLEYAFGGTAEQRFMGVLSSGEPVTPLIVRRNE